MAEVTVEDVRDVINASSAEVSNAKMPKSLLRFHYLTRCDGEYFYRYYPKEDLIEKIPMKPLMLKDLGLKRLQSGKIIRV